MNQLLCALRFYATGCHQLIAADFGGFSKTSAHRIIHRVSDAIARLGPQQIVFPDTAGEIRRTQTNFYRIARFPRVVGALDCTHIKIQSPGEERKDGMVMSRDDVRAWKSFKMKIYLREGTMLRSSVIGRDIFP